MPLFPYKINADTISSANIIGVNKVLINSNYIESVTRGNTTYNRFTFTYEYEILLDDYYLGYINGSLQQSYRDYDVSMSTPTTENRSLTKPNTSYYVNGNSFKTSSSITAWCYVINGSSQVDPTNIYNPVFSLNTSNIHKYQDIDSIDTVIDILNDINTVVSIDILSELQSLVSNTSLSNDYLDLISQVRQYNFPIESLPFILKYCNEFRINSGEYALLNWPVIYRYQYPIFKVSYSGSYFEVCTMGVYKDKPVDIVFWVSTNQGPSTINNYIFLNDTNNFQFDLVERITTTDIWTLEDSSTSNNKVMALYHFKVSYIGSNIAGQVRLRTNINPLYIIPIFYGVSDYCSTDFCLNYGLQNQIMRNLNIIAQGTAASSSSSNDLEDSADDIVQNSNTMFQFENQQNTNMNNALQSINTNFDIGTIGSSFLSSAAWVKTQFDNLTNTTPFGSVLSFSLLLGLALLIIGKVYK